MSKHDTTKEKPSETAAACPAGHACLSPWCRVHARPQGPAQVAAAARAREAYEATFKETKSKPRAAAAAMKAFQGG
jgi:hypothetical protein